MTIRDITSDEDLAINLVNHILFMWISTPNIALPLLSASDVPLVENGHFSPNHMWLFLTFLKYSILDEAKRYG